MRNLTLQLTTLASLFFQPAVKAQELVDLTTVHVAGTQISLPTFRHADGTVRTSCIAEVQQQIHQNGSSVSVATGEHCGPVKRTEVQHLSSRPLPEN